MDYPLSLMDVYLHLGKFTDGTADGVVPPSRDPAAWNNAVTDELLAIIVAGGLTPDETNHHQVRDAISAMIASAAISGLKALAYLDAGQGIEPDGAGNARVKLNGATLLRTAAGLALNLAAANVWAGQQSCQVADLTDAATIVWHLEGEKMPQMAKVTIAATRLLAMPTDHKSGTRYALRVIHGAANTTLSFAAGYKAVSALALSSANGAVDILVFESDGTYMSLVDRRLDVLGA